MSDFDLAVSANTDAYFARFTDDAIVEDEGTERRGIAAIRAWRPEVPSVRYDVKSLTRDDDTTDALVEVSGSFPGSPVVLSFHFEHTHDGRIAVLRIR